MYFLGTGLEEERPQRPPPQRQPPEPAISRPRLVPRPCDRLLHLADSELGPRSARVTIAIPCWRVTCASQTLKKIGDVTGTEPTPEQARQVIEKDAGGAAAIVLRAANALRDKEPTALAAFSRAFRLAPEKIWSRNPTARLTWSQVVETRLRTVLRLLEQCKFRVECWGSNDPKLLFTVRPGVFRIALGAGYWITSWGNSDWSTGEGVFVAAPLQIYYGPWMTFRPGGQSDASSICYVHFALAVAGRDIPEWVEKGCAQPIGGIREKVHLPMPFE
jgi:hypothetical protein